MRQLCFYKAATQFENLGDIVLAEEIVRRARESGALLVVDDRGCPADYLEHLALADHESVLHHGGGFKRRLLRHALMARLGGPTPRYLLKPGHQGNAGRGAKPLLYAIWLRCLKAAGARISRYGTSIELPHGPARRMERLRGAAMADYTLRDSVSIDMARDCGIAHARYFPDLAFGLGRRTRTGSDLVCASFRADLARDPGFEDRIVDLLKATMARRPGAELVIVSQVHRDDAVNRALAERTGSELVSFTGDRASRAAVFERYGRSTLVLSNRLHVLLFGASRGAVPVPVLDAAANAKVVRVFDAAGLGRLVFDGTTVSDLATHLDALQADAAEVDAALERAFADGAHRHF